MKRSLTMVAALSALMMLVTACGGKENTPASGSNPAPASNTPKVEEKKLSGVIKIDGSSTVYPITEAVAEEFMKKHKGVNVTVGFSGTSAGFKKWLAKETDMNDASREIKSAEKDAAAKAGIQYTELAVAYDGLSVVVSRENTWLQCITKAELTRIWDQGSTVKRWNEVNPAWPNEEIKLYGPGADSGTFDYFTEWANGKSGKSRADYTASEDDNVLVQGVTGNKNSLGYFGYAYYQENATKMRAVPVDGGKGCIEPKDETISNASYPIARTAYIYVNSAALEREEVKEFARFYIQNAPQLVPAVGYTALPQKMYDEGLAKLK